MDPCRPRVESLVAQVLGVGVDELTDASGPDSLPAWDSFAHLDLVLSLESAYGVSFAPEETLAILSVGRIKAALRGKGVDLA